MEQALKILEAMGCHIQKSEAVASSHWSAEVLLGIMWVLLGILALFSVVLVGYGAYYVLAEPCRRYLGFILISAGIFCLFAEWGVVTSVQKSRHVQQYTVVLDDTEFLAASSAGVRLEPYDPETNTYQVLGMG